MGLTLGHFDFQKILKSFPFPLKYLKIYSLDNPWRYRIVLEAEAAYSDLSRSETFHPIENYFLRSIFFPISKWTSPILFGIGSLVNRCAPVGLWTGFPIRILTVSLRLFWSKSVTKVKTRSKVLGLKIAFEMDFFHYLMTPVVNKIRVTKKIILTPNPLLASEGFPLLTPLGTCRRSWYDRISRGHLVTIAYLLRTLSITIRNIRP